MLVASESNYQKMYGNISTSSEYSAAPACSGCKCNCSACNSCACGRCDTCISACRGCKSFTEDNDIEW